MGESKLIRKCRRVLYEKDGLNRWLRQCRRSCEEANAFLECGKKKKKR